MKGHRDAVVFFCADLCTVERASSVYYHAVRGLGDIRTHGAKVFRDRDDPVRFLDAKLGSVLYHGHSISIGGRDSDNGKLVDEGRDDIA